MRKENKQQKGISLFVVAQEVWTSKKLTADLAKNDFKSRFAGSYLGIIWAFVQPIVTVFVYWFVFEKALSTGTQSLKGGMSAPYVLWLIAGLVPWFYFSETITSGTRSLVEYDYLVKKVVFNISTLPIVKVISGLFVHGFFIIFTLILYGCYHYAPTWYTLQILYYSFAMICLCIGIVYATSAIMVFFKDLFQIVNIVLQVLIWATPIMWNIDNMTSASPTLVFLLKCNPLYYIVSGYRDALLNRVWFWERPGMTIYYWVVTILVMLLGTSIFRKLRIHFADVL
jgi:teichoic acid transport system permease protein